MTPAFYATLNELLVVVIPIIITALLGWISPYVVKLLDAKAGHNTTQALENFARIAVSAAEQQIKTGANSDKKDLALAALSAFAGDHKYDISAANLEALIEAAVFQLKQWGPLTLTATPSTVPVVDESTPTVPISVDVAAPAVENVDPAPDHTDSVNWS